MLLHELQPGVRILRYIRLASHSKPDGGMQRSTFAVSTIITSDMDARHYNMFGAALRS